MAKTPSPPKATWGREHANARVTCPGFHGICRAKAANGDVARGDEKGEGGRREREIERERERGEFKDAWREVLHVYTRGRGRMGGRIEEMSERHV